MLSIFVLTRNAVPPWDRPSPPATLERSLPRTQPRSTPTPRRKTSVDRAGSPDTFDWQQFVWQPPLGLTPLQFPKASDGHSPAEPTGECRSVVLPSRRAHRTRAYAG